MENKKLDAALKYEGKGYSVIPIKPKDKRPLVKWEKFQTERASADLIWKWWKTWPDANIGLVTGRDFDVIDVDTLEAEDFIIANSSGDFNPPTLKTPHGKHYLYIFRPFGTSFTFC